MDLDRDGDVDLLSGSYSRVGDGGMAGLFQVLRRERDGGFAAPTPVLGTDGAPLIVQPLCDAKDEVVERICTRPFAADLDGDGHLDIVTGNFTGTFAWFRGVGPGRFEPESHGLVDDAGELLRVRYHSDPFLVDWDADGDLDLVSGSESGGVSLFENRGTAKAPSFAKPTTLVPPREKDGGTDELQLGLPELDGPRSALRVAVHDVDGDGKLDLLVGDTLSYAVPAEGLTNDEARRRYAKWQTKYDGIIERKLRLQQTAAKDPVAQEALQRIGAELDAHYDAQRAILERRGTGFVWLYRRL